MGTLTTPTDLSLFCVCVSSTAIAIRCKDGVVFGVEKLVLSKLYEEGSNKRIFNIDRHVGMVTTHTSTCSSSLYGHMIVYICTPQAVAGLLADARSLADVAREEASSFRSNYGHDIPLKVSPNLSRPKAPSPLSVIHFMKSWSSISCRWIAG